MVTWRGRFFKVLEFNIYNLFVILLQPFAEIIKLTTHQEGIITRCIQQLCETLRDAQDAARMIGDTHLHEKMTEASNSIKRDIVFAASLYTQ
jgi:antiviral helicase SKI2